MSNEEQDKHRLISMAEAAEMYGFSRFYMAELAKRGRLKATRVGRSWVTTPADVEEFIQDRQRKGVYKEEIQI